MRAIDGTHLNMERLERTCERIDRMYQKAVAEKDVCAPLWITDYVVINTALKMLKDNLVAEENTGV